VTQCNAVDSSRLISFQNVNKTPIAKLPTLVRENVNARNASVAVEPYPFLPPEAAERRSMGFPVAAAAVELALSASTLDSTRRTRSVLVGKTILFAEANWSPSVRRTCSMMNSEMSIRISPASTVSISR
jgi:hypothetical protein